MRGDATLFTRRDEVEAEWRIITPIEEAWAHLPAPEFPNYAAGSEGPISWRELLDIRDNTGDRAICYSRYCPCGMRNDRMCHVFVCHSTRQTRYTAPLSET